MEQGGKGVNLPSSNVPVDKSVKPAVVSSDVPMEVDIPAVADNAGVVVEEGRKDSLNSPTTQDMDFDRPSDTDDVVKDRTETIVNTLISDERAPVNIELIIFR